ncbi:MAG TPA: cob(I)yrinic acid a,c-diamide adenosyltransferase [Burkholderiales bacterium]|nr:cob(I)yrinic acid a,c-diamide adenosyltransferase [Burkholderiales bacterium]
MGYRLSTITTRTGDSGETGLGDGTRLSKDHPRIVALGDLDELNSCLGVLASEDLHSDMQSALIQIQNDLFDLGGEISIPGHRMLQDSQVETLESWITRDNAALPPLTEFILPGGSKAAAYAHLARTICRRAERSIVHLGRTEAVSATARIYLNRLSDLLFIWSRVINRQAGVSDRLWKRRP